MTRKKTERTDSDAKPEAAPPQEPDSSESAEAPQVGTAPRPKAVEPDAGRPEGAEAEPPQREAEGGEPAADPVAALQAEVASLKDQLLRALAETENTRRRLTRERDEASRYGAAAFARDIVSVADNLRRALEAVPSDAVEQDAALKALADGVKLTEDELLKALERHGVKRIDPYGEKFDHNHHQAMFEVENSGHPPGTVAQVLAPGYLMHDRLLRPAMVGVAKGAPAAPSENNKVDTTA